MDSVTEDSKPVKPELNNSDVQAPEHNNQQQDGGRDGGNQQQGGHGFGGGPNRRGGGRFNDRGGGGGGQRRPGPYNQRGGGGGGHNAGGPGGHQRRQGGPGGQGDRLMHNQMDKINDKLSQMAGPTYDLPPIDLAEKKFNGRTRLYIGNIGNDTEEGELIKLFEAYGETSEFFLNKEKNFAFIRLDYRSNAEKAKRELDGSMFKGRSLKIRFAPNGSTIKVRNLTNFVSNELLYHAFQVFGEIERAYMIVDERGKPSGEGIVEFARKGCALNAVRKCSEGCFFLTGSLRPCIVESYEPNEETDGYPDKFLPKKNPEYLKQREVGPRFASPSSFEYEYGSRWKQMHDLYTQKEMALKKEFEMEKEKLEAQMEFARYEHETEMLRDQLRAREMDRERQKHEWEMKERLAEEQRQRTEEAMRRQQEEMQARIVHQDEEMRRRQQENTLFMQAHQLDSLLDQQEQSYEPASSLYDRNDDSASTPVEPKAFMNSYKRNTHRFDGPRDLGGGSAGPRNGSGGASSGVAGGGGSGGAGARGHWVNNDNRRDDFPHKRRRF